MKKYLMTGIAALAIGAAFVSCSHEIEQLSQEELQQYEVQKIKANYEQAFVKVFGTANNRDNWGFSDANTRTRSITVNGDVYDKFPSGDEINANFPTAIPEDAKTEEQIMERWKGQHAVDENGNEILVEGYPVTMWDEFAVYKNMVGNVIKNILVNTPGEFEVGHTWNNPQDRVYNVYIAVGNGKSLTLKRNGAEHVNFYIMSGNVTIDKNFGECGGIISVAQGATVIDERDHIAHNHGIKVFNRGTYNATNTTPYWNGVETTSVFDIGNFCTFYNEGKFVCNSGFSYSPGMANTSYFMNLGDEAEVTAASMTLNSAGNFFNSGKVNITGETNVTQQNIYWVNAGHYTTGSLNFSAWNKTFYNYCQLIVEGQAYMHDGEFNLMENSYTEVGSAEMGNFAVNMGSNTGMYIKGNLRLLGQGDNTYQGFRTEGTKDYLLIDGKAIVDCHPYTFSISSGITYSIKQVEIVNGDEVVQENKCGTLPVYVFNGTECPYGSLTVTPNTNSCGATWNGGGSSADLRVMAEDLSAGENGDDFDFNDVVFDVYFSQNQGEAYVMVLAAGGTLPLKVHGTEVHGLFGKNAGTNGLYPMINTHAEDKGLPGVSGLQPQKIQLTGITVNSKSDVNQKVKIEVQKSITTADGVTTQRWIELENTGVAACKIGVSPTINWANERENVSYVCSFNQWVAGGKLEPTYPNN